MRTPAEIKAERDFFGTTEVRKIPLVVVVDEEMIVWLWRRVHHPFYRRRPRRMAGK